MLVSPLQDDHDAGDDDDGAGYDDDDAGDDEDGAGYDDDGAGDDDHDAGDDDDIDDAKAHWTILVRWKAIQSDSVVRLK